MNILANKLDLNARFVKADFSGGARKSIRLREKRIVWDSFCESINEITFCPVCTMVKDRFEVCHIQSANNGGKAEWNNLFIGCQDCNKKMAEQNLQSYLSNVQQINFILRIATIESTEQQAQQAMRQQAEQLMLVARSIAEFEKIQKFGLNEKLEKAIARLPY